MKRINRKRIIKAIGNNKYISIIIPNIDDLNSLIKSHRLDDGIRTQDSTIRWLRETPFTGKHTEKLKIKGCKTLNPASNRCRKWAELASLTSDKVDVKPKLVRRDKGRHYLLLKENIR